MDEAWWLEEEGVSWVTVRLLASLNEMENPKEHPVCKIRPQCRVNLPGWSSDHVPFLPIKYSPSLLDTWGPTWSEPCWLLQPQVPNSPSIPAGILCYIHFQSCCVFSYSRPFVLSNPLLGKSLNLSKISTLSLGIPDHSVHASSIGIFCCEFCFTHLSFSIDCEWLEGKVISYLPLVFLMPSVNNVERIDRWWRAKISVFALTFILQDLIKVPISSLQKRRKAKSVRWWQMTW